MDQRQHAEPFGGHLADLQIVGILDHAVHRRAHVGARQVELRLVDRRLRLAICGCSPGADRRLGVGSTGSSRRRAAARQSSRR